MHNMIVCYYLQNWYFKLIYIIDLSWKKYIYGIKNGTLILI